MTIKRILKINNSWTELFNFQNSFNYHWLELLKTAPLPIHKIIIIATFLDGGNGIYLYFVNKLLSSWSLLGLQFDLVFDPRRPVFELVWDFIKTNILIEFQVA